MFKWILMLMLCSGFAFSESLKYPANGSYILITGSDKFCDAVYCAMLNLDYFTRVQFADSFRKVGLKTIIESLTDASGIEKPSNWGIAAWNDSVNIWINDHDCNWSLYQEGEYNLMQTLVHEYMHVALKEDNSHENDIVLHTNNFFDSLYINKYNILTKSELLN